MRRWRDSQEFASPRLCSATLATEGDPIERVHALVGPNCTIGAELDPHGHPTPERVHHAGIVVLYKEFPHIDVVERAEDLLTLVPRTIRGEIRPIMSLYDCRQVGGYPTTPPPMRAFVDKTAAMEGTDGVLPVSIGHCFPYAGVPELSGRILATTDGGKAKADRPATAIGEEPAGMRGKTPPEPVSVEAGIAAALRRDCWQSFGPTQVPVGDCAAIRLRGVEVVPIANRTQAPGPGAVPQPGHRAGGEKTGGGEIGQPFHDGVRTDRREGDLPRKRRAVEPELPENPLYAREPADLAAGHGDLARTDRVTRTAASRRNDVGIALTRGDEGGRHGSSRCRPIRSGAHPDRGRRHHPWRTPHRRASVSVRSRPAPRETRRGSRACAPS